MAILLNLLIEVNNKFEPFAMDKHSLNNTRRELPKCEGMSCNSMKDGNHITSSRPQVDACVLAFLRNRGNWNTQAHTGRIVVDKAGFPWSVF